MKKAITIILSVAVTSALVVLAMLLLAMPSRNRNTKVINNKCTDRSFQGDSIKLSGNVYNLMIIDESGSMGRVWKPALDGANETIQTIKANQAKHPEQHQYLTFVSFSDKGGKKFRTLYDASPINEVKDLTTDEYEPSGNTPLWDAMGFSLSRLETKVTEADLVLVTIITDGYENASVEYSGEDIKSLVKRLSDKDWAFAYIGANQDAIAVAGEMGIKNALQFEADEEGTRNMWMKERNSRERYYSRGRLGTVKSRLKEGYFEDDSPVGK